MPRIRSAEAAGVGADEEDRASCQSMEALMVLGTEICTPEQHLTKEWLLPLAFRKRLITGEVATESSGSSAASTEEASETATVGSIRNEVCCPTSATSLNLNCRGGDGGSNPAAPSMPPSNPGQFTRRQWV